MKICAAQCRSVPGDIEENLLKHQELVSLAVSYNADFIFFPELSVTGYEPSLAKELAMDQDDARLNVFQELSDTYRITIGIGIPTIAPARPRISILLFPPNAARQLYSKQQLHPDELPFFTPGDQQTVLYCGNHALALAICYESLQPSHAANVAKLGANVYLASVAKHDRGVAQAYEYYPNAAEKHAMTVLMANCVGPCDDYIGAGRSAVWSQQGKLAGALDEVQQGIVMVDTLTEAVSILDYQP
ncbi:carbon-nitrogen hydrolase family protein [Halomonas shantousis]